MAQVRVTEARVTRSLATKKESYKKRKKESEWGIVGHLGSRRGSDRV